MWVFVRMRCGVLNSLTHTLPLPLPLTFTLKHQISNINIIPPSKNALYLYPRSKAPSPQATHLPHRREEFLQPLPMAPRYAQNPCVGGGLFRSYLTDPYTYDTTSSCDPVQLYTADPKHALLSPSNIDFPPSPPLPPLHPPKSSLILTSPPLSRLSSPVTSTTHAHHTHPTRSLLPHPLHPLPHSPKLTLPLSNIPAPPPQHAHNLRRDSRSERNTDEDKRLMDRVGEGKLGPDA